MEEKEGLVTDALSRSQSLFASGVLSASSELDGEAAAEEASAFDNPAYEVQEHLGQGSYGVVMSARCTTRAAAAVDTLVAVKMVSSAFQENTLLAKRTLREIWLLRRLRHDNVIAVLDFYSSARRRLFLVLPLMDTDLQQVISSDQPLRQTHVVYLAYQILKGVQYLHACGILHRDLKPSNVLVNEDCSVRIADMGMARLHGEAEPATPGGDMTEYVVSRWWRGPEVMVDQHYSFPLDVWSVGCIAGEMLLRKPLFPGRDYADQLVKIVVVLGKPDRAAIARMKDAGAREFVAGLRDSPPVVWSRLLPEAGPEMVALLSGSLAFVPDGRLTAAQLLALPLFRKLVQSDPAPPPAPAQVLLQDWREEDIVSVKDVEVLIEKELQLAKQERDERMNV